MRSPLREIVQVTFLPQLALPLKVCSIDSIERSESPHISMRTRLYLKHHIVDIDNLLVVEPSPYIRPEHLGAWMRIVPFLALLLSEPAINRGL